MPKDTPKGVVEIFSSAVKQVMDSEEFKANAMKTDFPSDFQGPEEYTAFIKKLDGVYRPLWEKYGKEAISK